MRKKLNMLVVMFGLFVVFSVSCVDDVYALEIKETDIFGNQTILLDVDSSVLQFDGDMPNFLGVGQTFNWPDPNIVARQIDGLGDTIRDLPIPEGASFLLLDFGPLWSEVIETGSDFEIYGRYLFVFYGLYDPDQGTVVAGDDRTGNFKYEWQGLSDTVPDERTLTLHGPYCFVSFNSDTGAIYSGQNKYNRALGNVYTLTFTGIVADTDDDNADYFPRVITFGDADMSYMQCGSHYLFNDWTNYNWDSDYSGKLDLSVENTDGFWDYITDGKFTDSENPVVQIFAKALQGIGACVEFVQSIPNVLESLVSFLPDEFQAFILISAGILISIIVIKFALHVVG